MTVVAAVLIGYALGSIPFPYLVARHRGIDLRRVGSGNVGVGNVSREVGLGWAFLTFALDAGKAVAAMWLAGRWGLGEQLGAAVGLIVGHDWPVWLRFVGGRGQLVTLVAGGFLAPWATLLTLPLLGAGMFSSRLAAAWFVGALLYPPIALVLDGPTGAVYGLAAASLTFIRRLQGSPLVGRAQLREAWRTRLVHDREP